jgi:hypothetical protein
MGGRFRFCGGAAIDHHPLVVAADPFDQPLKFTNLKLFK